MSDDTIAALLAGVLQDVSLQEAHAHLAQCTTCRNLWTAAAQAQSQPLIADSAIANPSTSPSSSSPDGLPHPTNPLLPRGTNVGRFVVLGVVGSGGMSVVYSAYDPELDRKVALKFLRMNRPTAATAQALRMCLQREAQAMARLVHPCVITVHDIGTFRGDVFIAMEFVDGCTLSEWCVAQPRRQGEILALFRRVGEGLAAAHRVGIVHRDFKPSNVLVSRQGDVRITDFGLARLAREQDMPATEQGAAEADSAEPKPSLPPSLNPAGSLLGTPAYMAPEQFTRRAVDARADQWSFCVALYEALHGKRPFVAASISELAQLVQSSSVQISDALPSRVRRVLLCGLRRDPAARFANMDALLAVLTRDPGPARRRMLYGIGVAALGAVALLSGYKAQRGPAVCSGAEAKLAGIWDTQQRDALRTAFLRTARPFASAAFAEVERALSAYAAGFVRMHTDACEATRIRAEQSEKLMDLRIGCLELRRKDLAAVRDVFLRADAQVVERAQRISAALPSLDACANTQELLLSPPPPADPTLRAQLAELEAALAQIRVQHSAGQYEEGLQGLLTRLPQVRELGHRRLRAEYLHTLAKLRESTSRYDEAEKLYHEAIFDAQAAHADTLAARGFVDVLHLFGEWKPSDPLVVYLRQQAVAAIARVGDPPSLLAAYYVSDGIARSQLGDHDAARALLERGLALHERAGGPQSYDVARTLMNLGTIHRMLGRFDDAVRSHSRAMTIADPLFGPAHPFSATIRTNLGNALSLMGKPAEALPLLQQALAAYDASYPKPNMHTSTALLALGVALGTLKRYDEAYSLFLRDLQLCEALLGKEHPRSSVGHRNLAEIRLLQRRFAEAKVHYEEALRISEKGYGVDHPEGAVAYLGLGRVARESGQLAVALAHYRRAHAIYKRVQKQPDQEAIEAQLGVGESLTLLGQLHEALPIIEQALALVPKDKNPLNDKLRAGVSFALAKVLWMLARSGDKARALELAQSAQALLSALPMPGEELAEIKAWIVGHRLL